MIKYRKMPGGVVMPRTVGIGHQDFEQMIMKNNFYIDKTMFIKEWWENDDDVTLITRPRRFGKMLNLNMTACFFSVRYAGRSDLFQSLSIWRDEKYRKLQRTYPVIFLSFAGVKETSFPDARKSICQIIKNIYNNLERAIMTGITRVSKESVFSDLNHIEVVTTTSRKV